MPDVCGFLRDDFDDAFLESLPVVYVERDRPGLLHCRLETAELAGQEFHDLRLVLRTPVGRRGEQFLLSFREPLLELRSLVDQRLLDPVRLTRDELGDAGFVLRTILRLLLARILALVRVFLELREPLIALEEVGFQLDDPHVVLCELCADFRKRAVVCRLRRKDLVSFELLLVHGPQDRAPTPLAFVTALDLRAKPGTEALVARQLDSPLLGQRQREGRPRDEPLVDDDLAEPATGLLLLREHLLELTLREEPAIDEHLAERSPK